MKTSDAAKEINAHPLNLMLQLKPYLSSFDEFWPNVEPGFIETLKHEVARQAPRADRIVEKQATPTTESCAPKNQVSASAAKVVRKLWGRKHWGKKEVSWDTLHNHFCRGVENLEQALEELLSMGLLLKTSDGRAYSLNPSRKAEIDSIANPAAHS